MSRLRWRHRAAVLVVVCLLAVGIHVVADRLGVPHTLGGLRARVAALGWWGPAGLLALMTLRQFLALPSALLLTVAGVCFGVATATIVGATGLILSALLSFLLARTVLRDWVAEHEGSRARRLEAMIARVGPAVIGVSTAHPMGMLTPLHWAAGLSALPLGSFVAALAIGAPIRAFLYALFGAAALDPSSLAFRASLVLALATLVPLAFRRVRRRVFGTG